jgi:hypothetical protein
MKDTVVSRVHNAMATRASASIIATAWNTPNIGVRHKVGFLLIGCVRSLCNDSDTARDSKIKDGDKLLGVPRYVCSVLLFGKRSRKFGSPLDALCPNF